MATWDELKIILARLEDADPGPLISWPGPEDDTGRQPPFQIELAPWAADVAAELHARFGADVELRMGALQYPQRTAAGSQPGRPRAPLPEAEPAEIEIALGRPLRISSGHAALHGLLVSNYGHPREEFRPPR